MDKNEKINNEVKKKRKKICIYLKVGFKPKKSDELN